MSTLEDRLIQQRAEQLECANNELEKKVADLTAALSAHENIDGFQVMGQILTGFDELVSLVINGKKDAENKKELKTHSKRARDVEAAQLLGIIGSTQDGWLQKDLVAGLAAEGDHKAVRQRVIRFTKALAYFGLVERRVFSEKAGQAETAISLTGDGKKLFDAIRKIKLSDVSRKECES